MLERKIRGKSNLFGMEVDLSIIRNPKIISCMHRLRREMFLFGWEEYREGSHRTWSEYSERSRDKNSYTDGGGCYDEYGEYGEYGQYGEWNGNRENYREIGYQEINPRRRSGNKHYEDGRP